MADEKIHSDVESLKEPFRTLIKAGICAPSGDNTQGWDFGIDEGSGLLEIFRNEQRDTSAMNAGQRMTSIACGACAENVRRTAAANGWNTEIGFTDLPSVKVFLDCGASTSANIPTVVKNRHTNRKVYRGRRIGASERKTLEQLTDHPDGIEIRFITESAAIDRCAKVIGKADALMFGQRRFLRAFLDNVRFDQPANFPVDFGLSIGSLELNLVERQLLRQLRHLPEVVTSLLPMRRKFRQKATRLVRSASGLCAIRAHASTTDSEFGVGQAMQRAWLNLTELGFAVQPMMSLPVLLGEAFFTRTNSIPGFDDILATAYETIFGEKSNRFYPCAFLRFGDAPAVTARTGRAKCVTIRNSCMPRSKSALQGA